MVTCYTTGPGIWKHISTSPLCLDTPDTTTNHTAHTRSYARPETTSDTTPDSFYVPALTSDVPDPGCEKRCHSAESLQQVVDQTQAVLENLRKGDPRFTAVLSTMVRDEITRMAPRILDKLWTDASPSSDGGVSCQGSMKLRPEHGQVAKSATFSLTFRNKSQVSLLRFLAS